MKLNITVDINEIIEGLFDQAGTDSEPGHGSWVVTPDIDIKEEIKQDIINQVKTKVISNIGVTSRNQMDNKVKELIEQELIPKVNDHVAEFIAEGKMRHYGEELTLKELVVTMFDSNNVIRKMRDHIDDRAREMANEFRDRYDLLFASSLVAKMNDRGLLKEGVFKAIMSEQENNQ